MGDSMKKWRQFLKEEELQEKTRAKKEGVPLPSTSEALEKYVAEDFTAPEYFMQFSDINKLGINPSSKYNTPLGIYSYPITKQIFRLFTKGKLPFAQDRKYIIVFKPKEDKNIIISLGKRNNGGIDDETYEAALAKLDDGRFDDADKWDELASNYAKSETNLGKLWYLTYKLQDGNPRAWRTIMQKKLGIDGVVDAAGEGLIHPSERIQGVFFSRDVIEQVETIRNTETPEAINRREAYKFKTEVNRWLYETYNKYFGRDPDKQFVMGFNNNLIRAYEKGVSGLPQSINTVPKFTRWVLDLPYDKSIFMPGEEEEAEKLKDKALRHILTPIADRYVTEEWRRRFQRPHKELQDFLSLNKFDNADLLNELTQLKGEALDFTYDVVDAFDEGKITLPELVAKTNKEMGEYVEAIEVIKNTT
jgi:hypothetical protein